MKKIAIFIDGGYIHSGVSMMKRRPTMHMQDYVERIAHSCATANEEVVRILYYDCPLFNGTVTTPISKQQTTFTSDSSWLDKLAKKDLFAVRRGQLRFRGWALKKDFQQNGPLQDSDFKPNFQQKGVDMRIGLDMAIYTANKSVDLLALMTNDTDFIPPMKHARREGMQVALLSLPHVGKRIATGLLDHADYHRPIGWPT